MTVQLNHTIVGARDKKESAAFLSEILGLPEPFPFGPFMAVQVDTLTLDFVDAGGAGGAGGSGEGDIPSNHYAFLVSEDEFDEIFARITGRGIEYFADPFAHQPGEINTHNGGRGCYFADPGGQWLEILTRPYGSGSD